MKEWIKPKKLPGGDDRRKSSSHFFTGRRDFLKSIIFSGGVVVTRGMLKIQEAPQHVVERERPPGAPPRLELPPGRASMIAVDLRRCTGCRTCEVECAKHNQNLYSGKGGTLIKHASGSTTLTLQSMFPTSASNVPTVPALRLAR